MTTKNHTSPYSDLSILGSKVDHPVRSLETFPTPEGILAVALESEEFTSLCPITHQPDFYTIRVDYQPNTKCLESKSFKLYLWSFREEGHFCEALSKIILDEIVNVLQPKLASVELIMRPRGGVSITSLASYVEE